MSNIIADETDLGKLKKDNPTHYSIRISIHAPVKGATISWASTARRCQHFNPRTREGCDWPMRCTDRGRSHISIHAPVKGATFPSWNGLASTLDFNPRTREGCDLALQLGARDDALIISIHAPVKGATVDGGASAPHSIISIHAPVKGATSSASSISGRDCEFQSTHP